VNDGWSTQDQAPGPLQPGGASAFSPPGGSGTLRKQRKGPSPLSSRPNDFPPLPVQQVELADVVRYLTTVSVQGHQVFRDPVQPALFYVAIDDNYRIRISVGGGRSQVQLQYLGNMKAFLDVTSGDALETAVRELVVRIPGMAWPSRPRAARLSATTPATNYRTISELVGSAQVHAVFDPYLNNRALDELRTILSFGDGGVADGIRLLSSESTGAIPRFTKAGVDSWLQQLGISGEARVLPARSEHRRFMLLNDGQSLILGHSLNALHKNEAIRLEPDSRDREFFNSKWTGALPVS
jgi:hypothetical protein